MTTDPMEEHKGRFCSVVVRSDNNQSYTYIGRLTQYNERELHFEHNAQKKMILRQHVVEITSKVYIEEKEKENVE